ncbi:hypothetical protein ADK67_14655 [Saccharothrix sp. NRRL B-16348]|uniref:hypothetical protein n=1 Tax=Saccharothrix sp. NRRL B-16348 TaxID=1415542 RepID=UPI0006AF1121|nr:hypothetical protein [Saccharothrix sp. NRRL B-16348]KOX27063.1 hypothetical protein ADK67_14655 [Saccharothrix sp. NRRL B-16348]
MDNSVTELTARIQQLLATASGYDPAVEPPSPNAATFTSEPLPRSRLGMFCHADQLHFLTLPGNRDELAQLPIGLVGDPYADRIHVVRGIDFWIGDRSLRNQPPNPAATILLNDLLDDVAFGAYAAGDGDRAFVRRLLAADRPRIAGPCLLLGRDERTDTTTGLPEEFLDWLQRKATQAVAGLVDTLAPDDGTPAGE